MKYWKKNLRGNSFLSHFEISLNYMIVDTVMLKIKLLKLILLISM